MPRCTRVLEQTCVPFAEDNLPTVRQAASAKHHLPTVGLAASAEGNMEEWRCCWTYPPHDQAKFACLISFISSLQVQNCLVYYWVVSDGLHTCNNIFLQFSASSHPLLKGSRNAFWTSLVYGMLTHFINMSAMQLLYHEAGTFLQKHTWAPKWF